MEIPELRYINTSKNENGKWASFTKVKKVSLHVLIFKKKVSEHVLIFKKKVSEHVLKYKVSLHVLI